MIEKFHSEERNQRSGGETLSTGEKVSSGFGENG
jgi:hypothetical protein